MSQNSSQLESPQSKLDLSQKIWLKWLILTALDLNTLFAPSLTQIITKSWGAKLLTIVRNKLEHRNDLEEHREDKTHIINSESPKIMDCLKVGRKLAAAAEWNYADHRKKHEAKKKEIFSEKTLHWRWMLVFNIKPFAVADQSYEEHANKMLWK